MRQYNPVSSIISVILPTIVAIVLNFTSASTGEVGENISILNAIMTAMVLGVWLYNAWAAGRAGNRGFAIFIVAYWILGFLFIWLTNVAMVTGIDFFASLGFVGLIMLYVPLYGLLLVVHFIPMDYVYLYPMLFLVIMGVYLLSKKQGKTVAADKILMEELKAEKEKPKPFEEN